MTNLQQRFISNMHEKEKRKKMQFSVFTKPGTFGKPILEIT
jgi:hypothetical protein